MDEASLKVLIAKGESLELEFKSDLKHYPDKELVSEVASMANAKGGILLLGVEDSGEVTGVHPDHSDVEGIVPLVSNKTRPALAIEVESVSVGEKQIAVIKVPRPEQITATTDGVVKHRVLKLDGTPQSVPLYPNEMQQRQASMGLLDQSALIVEEITVEQLDPIQRARIRNAIREYNGEASLLDLSDDELDAALGLCVDCDGVRKPTVAGLMLLGTEQLLRAHLPAYEVAFQILSGTNVKVNEFYRKPLIEVFERVEMLFQARIEEDEIEIGLFRVPVPNYDKRGFRLLPVQRLRRLRDNARHGR